MSTINLAFRREVFDAVGGFDERFAYGSDTISVGVLLTLVIAYAVCLMRSSGMTGAHLGVKPAFLSIRQGAHPTLPEASCTTSARPQGRSGSSYLSPIFVGAAADSHFPALSSALAHTGLA